MEGREGTYLLHNNLNSLVQQFVQVVSKDYVGPFLKSGTAIALFVLTEKMNGMQ